MGWDRKQFELFRDSPLTDAFGRLRVANPTTLFDSKSIHEQNGREWSDGNMSGGGTSLTHQTNEASVRMAVSAATAGVHLRKTRSAWNYQPGKSQLTFITGNFNGGDDGVIKRFGLFTADNGLFFELDGDSLSVVKRSNVTGTPVEERIVQADWNLNPMNGVISDPGYTLDITQSFIMVIDFEWLGTGRVRLGYNIDGQTHYVHQFTHSNIIPTVYMSVPSLPVAMEIINDGTGAASSLDAICTTVISEGGRQQTGGPTYSDVTSLTVPINANTAGTPYALVGIRNIAARLDVTAALASASAIATSNDDFFIGLYWNPTVAGTFTYGDHGGEGSQLQIALGDVVGNPSANTLSGGTLLFGAFNKAASELADLPREDLPPLPLGSAVDGSLDTVVMGVTSLTSNARFFGSITWREFP